MTNVALEINWNKFEAQKLLEINKTKSKCNKVNIKC